MDTPEIIQKNLIAILPLSIVVLFFFPLSLLIGNYVYVFFSVAFVIISFLVGMHYALRYNEERDEGVFRPFMILFLSLLFLFYLLSLLSFQYQLERLGTVDSLCICGCGPPDPPLKVAFFSLVTSLFAFPFFFVMGLYPPSLLSSLGIKNQLKRTVKTLLIVLIAALLLIVPISYESANLDLQAYHAQPNRIMLNKICNAPGIDRFIVYPTCIYNDHLSISENMDAVIQVSYYNDTTGSLVKVTYTMYEAYTNWQAGNTSGIQYVDADHDLRISENDYILSPHLGGPADENFLHISGRYIEGI